MDYKVIVLMGSKKDLEFCRKICEHLKKFELKYELRVASAHKTPQKVLNILKEYENSNVVYITVAGKSNALSAFVDANTVKPVIACPPYSEKFAGADIYSSLRLPSGIGSTVILEPEGAAIAAAKILALTDNRLTQKIRKHQEKNKEEIELADKEVKTE